MQERDITEQHAAAQNAPQRQVVKESQDDGLDKGKVQPGPAQRRVKESGLGGKGHGVSGHAGEVGSWGEEDEQAAQDDGQEGLDGEEDEAVGVGDSGLGRNSACPGGHSDQVRAIVGSYFETGVLRS